MRLDLNIEQQKSLAGFFSNISVAWFIAAFVTPTSIENLIKFMVYGIFSLYSSLLILRRTNYD